MGEPVPVDVIVRARLDAAGIPYSDDELKVFIDQYQTIQKQAASLYIPETRYEEPNMIFSLLPYVKA
jgi:hypothetical protein